MTITIEVDDSGWNQIPALEDMTRNAVAATLAALLVDAAGVDIAILFTDDETVARLNKQWRGKDHPTNVLSFPAEDFPVPEGEPRPLGDIVLAQGVIAREAAEQGKSLSHHAIHLIIHGVLHLMGHDHQTESEAEDMEALEIEILKGLGISDPYERQ